MRACLFWIKKPVFQPLLWESFEVFSDLSKALLCRSFCSTQDRNNCPARSDWAVPPSSPGFQVSPSIICVSNCLFVPNFQGLILSFKVHFSFIFVFISFQPSESWRWTGHHQALHVSSPHLCSFTPGEVGGLQAGSKEGQGEATGERIVFIDIKKRWAFNYLGSNFR